MSAYITMHGGKNIRVGNASTYSASNSINRRRRGGDKKKPYGNRPNAPSSWSKSDRIGRSQPAKRPSPLRNEREFKAVSKSDSKRKKAQDFKDRFTNKVRKVMKNRRRAKK